MSPAINLNAAESVSSANSGNHALGGAGPCHWLERTSFEAIGDIADKVVALCGIRHRCLPDGRLDLNIP